LLQPINNARTLSGPGFQDLDIWLSGAGFQDLNARFQDLDLRTWVSGPRNLSILRSSYLFPVTFLCVHRHRQTDADRRTHALSEFIYKIDIFLQCLHNRIFNYRGSNAKDKSTNNNITFLMKVGVLTWPQLPTDTRYVCIKQKCCNLLSKIHFCPEKNCWIHSSGQYIFTQCSSNHILEMML
jgi:hypothetical protein